MIFQTKRVTSSAGGDLVYPSKALFLKHPLITILMINLCCQYGLPASTETVDVPIKPKPGTQEIRGWIRGWWMEPELYKVSPLRVSHCDTINNIPGLHCAVPAWHLQQSGLLP